MTSVPVIVNGEARHACRINQSGGWVSEFNQVFDWPVGPGVWAQWDEARQAAALRVAGLAAFRRGKSGSAGVKPSWLQTMLKGAGMVSTFWLAFRAEGHDPENKSPNSRA